MPTVRYFLHPSHSSASSCTLPIGLLKGMLRAAGQIRGSHGAAEDDLSSYLCGGPGIGTEIASVGRRYVWRVMPCASIVPTLGRRCADTLPTQPSSPPRISSEPHFFNVPKRTVPSCDENANCHTVAQSFRWERATTQGGGDGYPPGHCQ